MHPTVNFKVNIADIRRRAAEIHVYVKVKACDGQGTWTNSIGFQNGTLTPGETWVTEIHV